MAAHSLTRNLCSSHFHMQSHRPSQPLLFENCCGFPISAELVLRSFRRNRCNRFGLRACVQSHKDNCSNGSLGTNAKGPTPVRRPQVLNNVEIDLVDGIDRRYSTTVQGEPQWGNPLTFHDLSSRGKLVVAVDVDEVLGNFVSALNKFVADRYSSNHSVSEYHVYEFFRIWNCSRDEANHRVHEFFKTPYFKVGIWPIPGAQSTLLKLSRFCHLSVVTSRQNAIKEHTLEWIDKHFPGLFQEIHFGNHFALDGVSRSKEEICKSLGATVLIDDNPRYAIECAKAGIRVLLFDYENSYPWCKTETEDLPPLVTKVYNWEDVEKQLTSLVLSS
ncbi:uncharacterized protein LOC111436047 [Cucurbita moschata]|uniref:Uncharacterized protein LOC111436047 n=1 Tax=Cucurbita moschata TaxID=3662 RepID=A0A6J1EMY9_CUCMO|nr:uncharacterized protein LOC111436047 [Cucurbita moschata]XP_022929507.1 uncharacterized protein LOC111436047 [Cucurbita moschata]